MKALSATEAARGFSALLTSVEQEGETFLITRGGRVVARIEPATGTSGAAVKAMLRHYRPDAAWSEDLAAVRADLVDQERVWPG